MIPVRLKLRNFMSYRGDLPAFSFSGIHTACISGDNGAGKSSLIDAITWALWGKTRADSDDDLISTGADEVEVEFDFSASGNLYRIIRKRSKAKKAGSAGLSGLDFQIFSGEEFQSITGDTITKTQEAVKSLLRMDYDTFINSAYLRQGHADEFSRQTPAKRKEVLGSILKLDIYEELAETAKQKARERQAEKETLERTTTEIKTALSSRGELLTQHEDAKENFKTAEDAYQQKQADCSKLREQLHSLQNQSEQLNRFKADSGEREKQLKGWQKSADTTRELIDRYEKLLQQAQEIREGFKRYTAASQEFERMSLQLNHLNQLADTKSRLEKSVQSERARLNSQIEVSKRNVTELENRAGQMSKLESTLAKAGDEMTALKRQQDELSDVENRVKSLEEQLKEMRFQAAGATERIGEIEERIKLVSQNTEPHCPLCEKPLNDEERGFIIEKYTHEKKHLAVQIENASKKQAEIIKTLNYEMAGLKSRQTALQKKIIQNQSNISVLSHQINECRKASEELEVERKTLQTLEASLNSSEYAKNEQAQLSEINRQIASIDYNEEAYIASRKTIDETGSYREQQIKLAEAESQINKEKENLASAEDTILVLQNRLKADSAEIHKLEEEVKNLPEVKLQLQKAEAEQKQVEETLKNRRDLVYRLKARLEALAELENKLADEESRLKTVASEESTLKNLAQAFGKKGIQGMLIEMAIPEIETEANRILGRMTDNRMALKLESQKLKKTGGTAETLDINISDEVGTRGYEMYSGGEAFRIDFALRIALSKLLANRSGAPLPTLIIDEGFGTQDSIGLEKVKEAINAIQDDFEIILVITHIDELKNAFNNRIEVTKTPEGSMVSII